MKRSYIPGDSLTLTERRALAWCIKRAADNSCLVGVGPEYKSRVKLARRAMRKVIELWKQGK